MTVATIERDGPVSSTGACDVPLRIYGSAGLEGPGVGEDWLPGPPASRARIQRLDEIDASAEGAVVLILDDALSAHSGAPEALAALNAHVVVLGWGSSAVALAEKKERLFLEVDPQSDPAAARRAIAAAARHSAALLAAERAGSRAGRLGRDLDELTKIGVALASERDLDRLLELIVSESRRITQSDAGSLYLIESDDEGRSRMRFRVAQNDTLPGLPEPGFTLPLDVTSIAGAAATLGEPLRIDDAYGLPKCAPYSFDPGFDTKYGYRTRSVLAVPIRNRSGRTVGVLQLINRKAAAGTSLRADPQAAPTVLSYSAEDLKRVGALAYQAAVAIENSRLLHAIEDLFDGFARAAVVAIDQRDPSTAGHSLRVATLTCDLAAELDRLDRGPYRDVHFTPDQMRELRYAALLHDFGKVSVPEEVLVKAKKLPPPLIQDVKARFSEIRSGFDTEFHRRRAAFLKANGPSGFDDFEACLEAEYRRDLERVERLLSVIHTANEPRITPEEEADVLAQITQMTFVDREGRERRYLEDREVHYLSIRRGSLDDSEREQIQAHVTQTFRFLQEIPWTEDLGQVAEIAHGHHEKLNGCGYPRGLIGDQIPPRTRVLTVADIFDALTASDRPYKSAVPVDRALDIIVSEMDTGQLDGEIVQLLIDSQVYRRILETDWKQL